MCEDESTVHVRFGNFDTSIYESNAALASAAAEHASQVIERAVRSNGSARVVMATGNSQLGFVQALNQECAPWHLVTVFHMDEYIGLNADHPASFVRWIHDRVEVPLKPGCVHYLCGDVKDPEVECQRYELLLREAPIDLVCMGIGENGHIAFNEPNAARFDDERWVRVIRLDDASRRQQVGEGHFAHPEDVPPYAMSMTVPALLAARVAQVVVPDKRKSKAVSSAVHDAIGNACPATALRIHPHVRLFLDRESAFELLQEEGGDGADSLTLSRPRRPTCADEQPGADQGNRERATRETRGSQVNREGGSS